MSRAPLVPKTRFIGEDDRAYLYTAGGGLAPTTALDAIRRDYEHKAQGTRGRQAHAEVERECRTGLARLMGAEPGEIGLLGSAVETNRATSTR